MGWFLTLWNERTICAPDYNQHISVSDGKFKLVSHTSLLSMTHWMSQVGSFSSVALLNAVSMLAFTIFMLCDWDMKDLIAWGSCSFIYPPENQKECSARRAITDKIVSYAFKINGFVIPAMAWNLESPCIYSEYNRQTEDRTFNPLGISYVYLVKIQKEIQIKPSIERVLNIVVNNNNCLPSIKYVSKICGWMMKALKTYRLQKISI